LVVGEQDFTCSSKKARVRNGVYGTKAWQWPHHGA
jgi:hypothetical protein